MGYTPGYDKLLFQVGGHRVMHDRLQIVVQHPASCPGSGSGLDQRKTFHQWPSAISKLRDCGEELSPTQVDLIEAKGKEVAAARR